MRSSFGFSITCLAGPSSTITPPSMKTTRSPTSRANAISWVTTIIVIPSSARARITSSTSLTSSGSSALVTSSNSISFGFIASARAIATRCCCPPERRAGYSSTLSAKPTRWSSSRPSSIASRLWTPFTRIGASITLPSAVMWGKRLKLWKTMPISARLRATSDSRSS